MECAGVLLRPWVFDTVYISVCTLAEKRAFFYLEKRSLFVLSIEKRDSFSLEKSLYILSIEKRDSFSKEFFYIFYRQVRFPSIISIDSGLESRNLSSL